MRRRRVRRAPARTGPRPFRQAANDCGASDRPRWTPSGRRHAVSYEPSLDEAGPGVACRNCYADLRCGLDIGFFAVVSLAFLPAIGISISFWPLAALRGFLAGFDGLAGSAPPSRITAKASWPTLPSGRR